MNEPRMRLIANCDFVVGVDPDYTLRREVGRLLIECGLRVAMGDTDIPAAIYLKMETLSHSTRLVLDMTLWPKEVKT